MPRPTERDSKLMGQVAGHYGLRFNPVLLRPDRTCSARTTSPFWVPQVVAASWLEREQRSRFDDISDPAFR